MPDQPCVDGNGFELPEDTFVEGEEDIDDFEFEVGANPKIIAAAAAAAAAVASNRGVSMSAPNTRATSPSWEGEDLPKLEPNPLARALRQRAAAAGVTVKQAKGELPPRGWATPRASNADAPSPAPTSANAYNVIHHNVCPHFHLTVDWCSPRHPSILT